MSLRELAVSSLSKKQTTGLFVYLCICIWVFEGPKPSYLLKTVLHCKGSGILPNAIPEVCENLDSSLDTSINLL